MFEDESNADESNTFITDNRKAGLAEVATHVPVLTPFVTKCVRDKPADVFLRMRSGEHLTTDCSSGVQQGDLLNRRRSAYRCGKG